MKILIVSTPENSLPPKKYGGIEQVIYELILGLSQKKHHITVIAPKNSILPSNVSLISPIEKSLNEDKLIKDRKNLIPFLFVKEVIKIQKKFEIIHNHISYNLLLFHDLIHIPILTTEHNTFTSKSKQILYKKYLQLEKNKNIFFNSISKKQQSLFPNLPYIANIYHGINLLKYNFFPENNKKNNDFIFWMGRLTPEKGAKEAIIVSKKTNKRLFLSFTIRNKENQNYYNLIKLQGSRFLYFLPELNFSKKIYYLQHAKLFLFPIQWEEPFGLVMIESMACGTPVVAFARGSVPEVIKDGETGFIVNPSDDDIRGNFIIKKTGIEGLCEAVERIYSMPEDQYRKMRRACREHVEKNFTVERMVDEYEKVYEEILSKKR